MRLKLTYAIEGLIKRGWLLKYVKGGKWEREGSPKGKFPSKNTEFGTSEGSKKARKVKFPYITSITGGAP